MKGQDMRRAKQVDLRLRGLTDRAEFSILLIPN